MKFFEYIHGEHVWIVRIGKFQVMLAWQNEDPEKAEGSWKELSLVWA